MGGLTFHDTAFYALKVFSYHCISTLKFASDNNNWFYMTSGSIDVFLENMVAGDVIVLPWSPSLVSIGCTPD